MLLSGELIFCLASRLPFMFSSAIFYLLNYFYFSLIIQDLVHDVRSAAHRASEQGGQGAVGVHPNEEPHDEVRRPPLKSYIVHMEGRMAGGGGAELRDSALFELSVPKSASTKVGGRGNGRDEGEAAGGCRLKQMGTGSVVASCYDGLSLGTSRLCCFLQLEAKYL